MKVKQVRVSVSATINLGNYQNIKPEAEVVLESTGETEKELFDTAWEIVTKQIVDQWENLKNITNN